ncbi:hypothetical protein [Paenibacillus luteus]|nr:hypothetical protein [Paenibacillus luteus]
MSLIKAAEQKFNFLLSCFLFDKRAVALAHPVSQSKTTTQLYS